MKEFLSLLQFRLYYITFLWCVSRENSYNLINICVYLASVFFSLVKSFSFSYHESHINLKLKTFEIII